MQDTERRIIKWTRIHSHIPAADRRPCRHFGCCEQHNRSKGTSRWWSCTFLPLEASYNTYFSKQCTVAAVHVCFRIYCFGRLEALLTSFIVINWLFYFLVVIDFIRFKWRSDQHTLGCLDIMETVFFVVPILALMVSEIYSHPVLAGIGIALFATGLAFSTCFVRYTWGK